MQGEAVIPRIRLRDVEHEGGPRRGDVREPDGRRRRDVEGRAVDSIGRRKVVGGPPEPTPYVRALEAEIAVREARGDLP